VNGKPPNAENANGTQTQHGEKARAESAKVIDIALKERR
jgi:hypothetical protein